MAEGKLKGEILIIGFFDSEMFEGIPNVTFPLVVTTTVDNRAVSKILISDESLCNVTYTNIFVGLGLSKEYLVSYESMSLKVFNDSVTHS